MAELWESRRFVEITRDSRGMKPHDENDIAFPSFGPDVRVWGRHIWRGRSGNNGVGGNRNLSRTAFRVKSAMARALGRRRTILHRIALTGDGGRHAGSLADVCFRGRGHQGRASADCCTFEQHRILKVLRVRRRAGV
jgi:hypothetical protein